MQLGNKINTLKFIGSLFLFFILSISANAQQSETDKNIVIYDPLLWKHQLKLNASQREKIQQINLEFYQSIYKAAQEGGRDRTSLQLKANQYIEQRSHEIWEAFNPNQRRKWKRMWDHYAS